MQQISDYVFKVVCFLVIFPNLQEFLAELHLLEQE